MLCTQSANGGIRVKGLASKLIHSLDRRSIPPRYVVRRLNRPAIRTSLALLDGHLDAPNCKLILMRTLKQHDIVPVVI